MTRDRPAVRPGRRVALLALLVLLALGLLALPRLLTDAPERDTDLERALTAVATAAELNSRLLAAPEASGAVTDWCTRRGLADRPVLTTEHQAVEPALTTERDRDLLRVSDTDPIGVQRTRHTCGGRLVSDIETRYVVNRLPEPVREALRDGVRKPFDTLVADLGPRRDVLSTDTLWSPLPSDWATMDTAELRRHATESRDLVHPSEGRPLLRHEVLTTTADGQPVALSVETYRTALLQRGDR